MRSTGTGNSYASARSQAEESLGEATGKRRELITIKDTYGLNVPEAVDAAAPGVRGSGGGSQYDPRSRRSETGLF